MILGRRAALIARRGPRTTTVFPQVDGRLTSEDGRLHILQDKDIPYYATIFRIHGARLLFRCNPTRSGRSTEKDA